MIERAPHDREHPYTVIINEAMRDRRLSFQARGFLATFLTYPDGWKFNKHHFLRASDKDGARVVKTCLDELEAAGYITRRRFRNERGQWDYEYIFSEIGSIPEVQNVSPAPEVQNVSPAPEIQNVSPAPEVHFPSPVFPPPENVPVYKILSTLNTQEKNNNSERASTQLRRAEQQTDEDYIQPTLTQVIAYFQQRGRSDCAQSFFRTFSAQGWTTRDGHRIRRWRAFADSWITKADRYMTPPTDCTDEYGRKVENGRYAPTYDIEEIEKQLAEEFYADMSRTGDE